VCGVDAHIGVATATGLLAMGIDRIVWVAIPFLVSLELINSLLYWEAMTM